MANKNKEVTFYIQDKNAASVLIKPGPASKTLPEWYKRQPAVIEAYKDMTIGSPAVTIKKCMPVFDAMTAGYYLYAPCDIYINATDPEGLVKSIPQGTDLKHDKFFASHSREQYGSLTFDKTKYHEDVIRLTPGWSVGTPKGYSALFINPMMADNSPLYMVPGIIDTDQYVSDGYFSFFVNKTFNGVIKRGTPLVQVIPFKRESWKSVFASESESQEKHKKQRNLVRSAFVNAYKNMMRSYKEYD